MSSITPAAAESAVQTEERATESYHATPLASENSIAMTISKAFPPFDGVHNNLEKYNKPQITVSHIQSSHLPIP